jgi:hypothetical protein
VCFSGGLFSFDGSVVLADGSVVVVAGGENADGSSGSNSSSCSVARIVALRLAGALSQLADGISWVAAAIVNRTA